MRGAWFVLALVLATGPAAADDWGGIVPGSSTTETVRARYGPPSRTATQKLEGYDATRWIYEGARAPEGIIRLTIDFGLLARSDYRANVVRAFTLEPKPGAFNRAVILNGWGQPSAIAKPDDPPSFFYESGLIVYFDKDGWMVTTLVFTPPQPSDAEGARRP